MYASFYFWIRIYYKLEGSSPSTTVQACYQVLCSVWKIDFLLLIHFYYQGFILPRIIWIFLEKMLVLKLLENFNKIKVLQYISFYICILLDTFLFYERQSFNWDRKGKKVELTLFSNLDYCPIGSLESLWF